MLGGAFVAPAGFCHGNNRRCGRAVAPRRDASADGATFSLGLMLVVIAGAQLFTSDALMVMAWASGRLDTGRMLCVWGIVWLGNFTGALGVARWPSFPASTPSDMAKGCERALSRRGQSTLAARPAFFLGILCNVLVCLAAWVAMAARSITDKILAMFFP